MGTIILLSLRNNTSSYRAEVRKDGVRLTKCFKRRTDARNWITSQEAAINENRLTTVSRKYTVTDMIDRYMEQILPHKKKGTQVLQIGRAHV